MARKVFFSFHYDDVTRANIVRMSDVITRRYQTSGRTGARFYDKSLWEEAKKQSELAIKRMINRALEGSSVTCLLIGQDTWLRPWVRYEILKSVARGNGVIGVRIHNVGFSPSRKSSLLADVLAPKPQKNALGSLIGQNRNTLLGGGPFPSRKNVGLMANALGHSDEAENPAPNRGPNPLRYLGYTIDHNRRFVAFHEVGPNSAWRRFKHVDPVKLSELWWLSLKQDANNLEEIFPTYDWKAENGAKLFPDWIEKAAKQVGR